MSAVPVSGTPASRCLTVRDHRAACEARPREIGWPVELGHDAGVIAPHAESTTTEEDV
ncbi:MAG TPA: hypothetical protein VFB46_00950 [Gemmatimonadaceae bacterium]|nr:hypothetical protein [Gemmatimonadaceae bacterium]